MVWKCVSLWIPSRSGLLLTQEIPLMQCVAYFLLVLSGKLHQFPQELYQENGGRLHMSMIGWLSPHIKVSLSCGSWYMLIFLST